MQKSENTHTFWERIHTLSRDEKAALILLASALVLGTVVRLIHVANAGFPINDGGLFYTMTRDLQVNHFLIPAVTSYNNSSLPFAYPPLAFYLAGGLNLMFGFSLLGLMRWLPLIFNILCIPVFYHFARQLLRDPVKAGIAALFFALLKPSYEWLIMGGGLTRAPAMLFSLLALDRYLALIESDDKRWRRIITVAIFSALTFLTHLEIGWFTTYSLALLWVFKGRTKRNFISSIYIFLMALILTSPYWAQVLQQHSLQPFVQVLTSGGYDPLIILFDLIYFFNFTGELIFPVLAAIALAGIFISLMKREYLLPLWLVLNILLDARAVNRNDAIPVAMLIAVGIVDGIYIVIEKYRKRQAGDKLPESGGSVFFTLAGFLVIYLLGAQIILTSFLTRYSDPVSTHVVSQDDLKASEWIRQNTPARAKFIGIPSSTWWETDAVGEWFPALTGRTNVLTVQGSEWLPDYRQRISNFKEISAAIASGSLDIQTLLRKYPDVSYLYLPLAQYRNTAELTMLHSFLQDFPLVFQNADVEIFQLDRQ